MLKREESPVTVTGAVAPNLVAGLSKSSRLKPEARMGAGEGGRALAGKGLHTPHAETVGGPGPESESQSDSAIPVGVGWSSPPGLISASPNIQARGGARGALGLAPGALVCCPA